MAVVVGGKKMGGGRHPGFHIKGDRYEKVSKEKDRAFGKHTMTSAGQKRSSKV